MVVVQHHKQLFGVDLGGVDIINTFTAGTDTFGGGTTTQITAATNIATLPLADTSSGDWTGGATTFKLENWCRHCSSHQLEAWQQLQEMEHPLQYLTAQS